MGRTIRAAEEASGCTASCGALPSNGWSRECCRLNERKTPGWSQVPEDMPFCTACSTGCQRSVSWEVCARAGQTNSNAQRRSAGRVEGAKMCVWLLFNPNPMQAVSGPTNGQPDAHGAPPNPSEQHSYS